MLLPVSLWLELMVSSSHLQTINLCLCFEYQAQLTDLLLISRLELFSITYLAWDVPLGHNGTHGAWSMSCEWQGWFKAESFRIATLSSIEAKEFKFQRLPSNLCFLTHSSSTVYQSAIIIYLYRPSKQSGTTLYTAKQESGRWVSSGTRLSLCPIFQPFEQTTLWNSEITSYCFK